MINKDGTGNGGKEKKAKQWKVGITEKGMSLLNQYLEVVNRGSKRKIRVPDVLEFAVEKLGEKDIRKLQERVYTPDDKMAVMLEEHNQRNPERALSLEAFKAHLLEVYEKQGPGKIKSLKMEQMAISSTIENMDK